MPEPEKAKVPETAVPAPGSAALLDSALACTVCGESVPPARPLPRPVHLRPLPPDLRAAGGR